MSDTKTKKTRKRNINVSNEDLSRYREEGNNSPSPMATMLRTLPDAEAKKLIQRTENAVEKASKSALDSDETYQTARKTFEAAKNTYYRTKNSLVITDVMIDNPDFDPDAPAGDSNPKQIKVQRDKFQVRVAILEAQIDEITRKRSVAASEVADGSDPKVSEGILHKNMRLARDRKRALARKAMGLNGSGKETPPEVLNDGE